MTIHKEREKNNGGTSTDMGNFTADIPWKRVVGDQIIHQWRHAEDIDKGHQGNQHIVPYYWKREKSDW